uniref:4F5 domain-containing protein n=1 Tax=Rhabditophanes sp. KR3021 TaxID=114890 RepID=A0AC35TXE1_9BILA
MARKLGGNQRDLAREKNAKKLKEAQKSKGANAQVGNEGMSTEKRQERDAAAMRMKQEAALAKKAEQDKGSVAAGPKVIKYDPLK